MSKNKFAERLTIDNAVLAMVDHQTGLLVNVRDQDPNTMRRNIMRNSGDSLPICRM